jgi:hypothetical protein
MWTNADIDTFSETLTKACTARGKNENVTITSYLWRATSSRLATVPSEPAGANLAHRSREGAYDDDNEAARAREHVAGTQGG